MAEHDWSTTSSVRATAAPRQPLYGTNAASRANTMLTDSSDLNLTMRTDQGATGRTSIMVALTCSRRVLSVGRYTMPTP